VIIIHLLYMNASIEYINKLYDNMSYFDMYFSSVLLFIFLTLFVVLVNLYFSMLSNAETIKKNWANERCKPSVIPFAGFINKPKDESIIEFTRKNFYKCVTDILSVNMKISMHPFNINGLLDSAKKAYQSVDISFNELNVSYFNLEDVINEKLKELKNKIINVMIPIQKIMYSVKDIFARTQAVMISGLYTSLGNSMLLKSMVSEMVNLIGSIFTSLVVIITMMFLVPGLQGLAAMAASVSIVLSAVFITTNKSLASMFHITPGKMPRIPKCFDKDTLLTMNDGTIKRIEEIKIGDVLENNVSVTATMKLGSSGVTMYDLNGVIVSDSHRVFKGNNWIFVKNHPCAKKIETYNHPYIYCLNTSTKTIDTNHHIFLDWDEIYDEHLETIISNGSPYVKTKGDIHRYLDGGLYENTPIMMKDFSMKRIRDVKIGDVLLNGEKVYGLVKIMGGDLIQVNKYNLGHTSFKGGPNLNMKCGDNTHSIAFDSTVNVLKQISNPNKLYHLLTDKKTFYVGEIKMCDYNSLIDEILYL
jgi:hypothetical protein